MSRENRLICLKSLKRRVKTLSENPFKSPNRMNKEYLEVLKDPRWQRKRLEILNRDGFACQKCGNTQQTLAIHHREYLSGRYPWDYPGELLITLCQKCHEKEEADAIDVKDILYSFHYLGMFNDEIRKAFNNILEERLKAMKPNAQQDA